MYSISMFHNVYVMYTLKCVCHTCTMEYMFCAKGITARSKHNIYTREDVSHMCRATCAVQYCDRSFVYMLALPTISPGPSV